VSSQTRIVRAGGVLFYVRAEWVRVYFIDEALERFADSPRALTPLLGAFLPDLEQVECPETVHSLQPGRRASSYGGFTLGLRERARPSLLGELQVSQIVIDPKWLPTSADDPVIPAMLRGTAEEAELARHGWRGTQGGDFVDLHAAESGEDAPCFVTTGHPASDRVAWRRITRDLRVGLVFENGAASISQWRSACAAITPLYDWLTAEPESRSPVAVPSGRSIK